MSTYVIINILMAFVIDVYTSIEGQHQKEKLERRAAIELGRQMESEEREIERQLSKKHKHHHKKHHKRKSEEEDD